MGAFLSNELVVRRHVDLMRLCSAACPSVA